MFSTKQCFFHGGLTPPALVAVRTFAGEKNDFCDAETHMHKSGGRQPAVVSKNASATAGDFRGVITFATARPASAPRLAYASRSWLHAGSSSYMHGCDLQRCFVSHRGLTPPAPGAVRTSAGQKTICAVHERRFTRAAGVSPPWYDTNAGKSAVSHKRRIVRRAMRSESSAARHRGGLSPAPMQAQRGCTTSG
jgi:hypothetical protein